MMINAAAEPTAMPAIAPEILLELWDMMVGECVSVTIVEVGVD